MDITSVLSLLGGIALFLYGMDFLSDTMKRTAGARLEKILEKLTSNPVKGLALGTAATGIVQSSTATAVIVLGFVNAGIMSLKQAIPVVFGANIGSTVTGQLLRLGDIGSKSVILTLLKPSSFAPILVAIGVIFVMFVKKKKFSTIGQVLIGLGILFIGMTTMESAVAPLRESKAFQKAFTMFSNPLLGILVGILVTAIVQSSSASVGILQALTATGTITWGMAIPIILGENIGKAVPVFISSISTNRDAKKVAWVHFLFNVFGAVLLGGLIYLLHAVVGFSFWDNVVNRGNVADFHTCFNLITAIILMPLIGVVTKLLDRILPEKEEEEWSIKQFEQLSNMFLKTPGLALEQSRRVVCDMGQVCRENFGKVRQLLDQYDEKLMEELRTNEDFLDRAETKVSEYLVRVTETTQVVKETRLANELLRSITDFERIGDYCIRIAEVFDFQDSNGISFSEPAKKELDKMFEAVDNILKTTVDAYMQENARVAVRVEPLEEVINELRLLLEDHHVERLQNNKCSVQAGISYKEILNATDRIAGHCVNISVFLIQRLNDPHKFDAHEHLRQDHQEMNEEYKALYTYYETLYYHPILNEPPVSEEPALPEPEPVEEKEVKEEKKPKKEDKAKKDKKKEKKAK